MRSDAYRTIEAPARAEQRVDGSRFLADAAPVTDRQDVAAQVEAIRSREHKATHHCTAYRIGAEGEEARYNDDGEPSGTGGAPILRQIDARTLTNTLVVVTRYFGGTELGTGGLARACPTGASAVRHGGAGQRLQGRDDPHCGRAAVRGGCVRRGVHGCLVGSGRRVACRKRNGRGSRIEDRGRW